MSTALKMRVDPEEIFEAVKKMKKLDREDSQRLDSGQKHAEKTAPFLSCRKGSIRHPQVLKSQRLDFKMGEYCKEFAQIYCFL